MNLERFEMDMADKIAGIPVAMLVYVQTAWLMFTKNLMVGWQTYQHYLEEYPFMSVVVLAGAVVSFVPLLLFAAFIIATVFFTFLGFMLVEGTILLVAIMLLSGVLFVACMLTLGFGTTVAALWIIFNKLISLIAPGHQSAESLLIWRERHAFCNNQTGLSCNESPVSSSTTDFLTSPAKEE